METQNFSELISWSSNELGIALLIYFTKGLTTKLLEKKIMQFAKNKTAAISIAMLLIISIGASMTLIQSASAHTPAWQIPTYAYVTAEPNPVGVGQTINIYMWLDPVYGTAGGATPVAGTNASTASVSLISNNYRFQNYQLKITLPDGTTNSTTIPVITDTTSATYYAFTPTMAGTYNITFNYPGQAYGANGNGYSGSSLINDTYLPSSATTTLVVQQEPIPAPIGGYPLPTQYWTHPIYGENTNWYTISSNWLGTGAAVIPATGVGTITGFSQSQMNRYPGDAVGSLTSHIMWTNPLQMGGVVGGNYYSTPGVAYFEGSAYCNRVQNPIIINGILYYTQPLGFQGNNAGPTVAVDLRTGKQIWSNINIPYLSFGYIYNLWNPDQHGVYPPMLVASITGGATAPPNTWSYPYPTQWEVFDAYTGVPMFNVTNVPSGAIAAGPNNEQLRYVITNTGTASNPQWYLSQWNSSRLFIQENNPYTSGGSLLYPAIINQSSGAPLISTFPIPITGTTGIFNNSTSTTSLTEFVPYGSTLQANANIPINSTTVTSSYSITTYDWNVSLPWLNTMPLQATYNSLTGQYVAPVAGTNPVTVLAADPGQWLLCRNGSLPVGFAANNVGAPDLPFTFFAVSLAPSSLGQILWMQTYQPPAGNVTVSYGGVDPTAWNGNGYGVFVLGYEETMQWVGYSMTTGQQIWGPTASQVPFNYYGNPIYPYITAQMANGAMYNGGFGGVCYAYNLTNGNVIWTYGNGGEGNSTNAGLNTFYGDYPTFINAVGNGVIYMVTTEHTITDPIYKGALARAINATTGKEIWTLSDYTGEFGSMSYAIADGYNIWFNGYDNQLYSVGQGPSATTVTTSPSGSTLGDNVVIQGTVMDTSAGTTQAQQSANFPHGVPVASDSSMSNWMGYVYQQKPCPTNFTGVPVQLFVLDSNGNYRSIGTATTDINGQFSFTWKPDIPGDFKVYASFAGTMGYWPSSAETTFNMMQVAATPTATSSTQVPSNTDTYVLGIGIAIIVILVIIGAAIMMMLRKRA